MKSFGPSGSPSGALGTGDVVPVTTVTLLATVAAFLAPYLAPYVGGQEAAVALVTGLVTVAYRFFTNNRK